MQWIATIGRACAAIARRLSIGLTIIGRYGLSAARWFRPWVYILGFGVLIIIPVLTSLALVYGAADDLGVSISMLRREQALWISMAVATGGLLWFVAWLTFRIAARLVRRVLQGSRFTSQALSFMAIWALFPRLPKSAILATAWFIFQVLLVVPGDLLRMNTSATTGSPPSSSVSARPAIPDSLTMAVPTARETSTPATPPPDAESQRHYTEQETTRIVLDLVARFLAAVDGELRRAWGRFGKAMSLSDLTIAIAAWLALAFVLNRMIPARMQADPETTLSQLSSTLVRVARAMYAPLAVRWPSPGHNIAFLSILVLGSFLSLAAILSLPRLREANRPNSEVSVDALRSELQQLRITKDQLLVDFPPELSVLDNHAAQKAVDDKTTNAGTQDAPAGPAPLVGAAGAAGTAAANEPVGPAVAARSAAPAGTLAPTEGTPIPKPDHDLEAMIQQLDTRVKEAIEQISKKKKDYDSIGAQISALVEVPGIAIGANEAELKKHTIAIARYTADLRKLLASRDTAQAGLDAAQADLEEAQTKLSGVKSLDAFSHRFRDDKDRAHRLISDAASRGIRLKDKLIQDEDQAMADAISAYHRENIDRQGSREQTRHFQLVRDWFAQSVAADRAAARSCGEAIAEFRSDLAEWESRSRARLTQTPTRSIIDIGDTLPTFGHEECDMGRRVDGVPPDSPPLGESLGAFKPVAAWLLNADSLALALVAGLLGFGLLGSVISTFVKAQLEQQRSLSSGQTPTFVPDLTGVVLRGISAAVVLFLAVQGGLAVLSGPGAAPNPYVLLLACFVAAVFSERIWRKTSEYLTERLGDIENTGGSAAKRNEADSNHEDSAANSKGAAKPDEA